MGNTRRHNCLDTLTLKDGRNICKWWDDEWFTTGKLRDDIHRRIYGGRSISDREESVTWVPNYIYSHSRTFVDNFYEELEKTMIENKEYGEHRHLMKVFVRVHKDESYTTNVTDGNHRIAIMVLNELNYDNIPIEVSMATAI